jgi:hypothetical protein
MAVGSIELREIPRDALIDPVEAASHFRCGEILVARVDSLELRAIDRDTRRAQQIELTAQRDELAAYLANGLAVVLAEVGNGLEVGGQMAGQPQHLEVALALALQPSARRHPIEVAVDVKLEHRPRIIARPPDIERLDAHETELVEIETVDEHVNRSHRIVLGHVVIKLCRKQRRLLARNPFHKACHRPSLQPRFTQTDDTMNSRRFHTAWAMNRRPLSS